MLNMLIILKSENRQKNLSCMVELFDIFIHFSSFSLRVPIILEGTLDLHCSNLHFPNKSSFYILKMIHIRAQFGCQ